MRKVVYVDDYQDFAKEMGEFVSRFNNAECVTFNNPLEALSYLLENQDVDILITDYEMPQMNGFELAQKLIKEDCKVRIIVSSGHDVRTLENIRKQYGLDGKIEVNTKTNIEFLKKLYN